MAVANESIAVVTSPLGKPPRIASVGAGYWGKNVARNFAALDALAGIVDPDKATVEKLATEYRVPNIELEQALNDDAISGVAIAAPAAMHYRLARLALESGKHVFVEKPLALNLPEAEALVELALRLDRRLMVGHLLQYHSAFLKLRELVREGQLGRLLYIYSNRLNLGKIRSEEDILWSFAPHDISMILALVGQDPNNVAAHGSYHLNNQIADVTITNLEFPAGERAHIFVSWLHPFKEQKLVVVGSDAMAVFDDNQPWEGKLVLFPHRVGWRDGTPVPHKADPLPVSVAPCEPLRAECQHFLDCIATGATPRTDGREGLRVLSVLSRASAALQRRPEAAETSSPGIAARTPASRFPKAKIHESASIDEAVEIGDNTAIWHFSHVLARVKIGADCVIGQNVAIGPDVTVGRKCKIQNNVSIYKGVTLEDGVFCGPSCVFTNVNNPRSEIERKNEFRPTRVRRGATIGANATIVCGHDLGEYSFVAAGAVVTRNVPAFALVAGNPARRIGWMSRAGAKLGPDLVCPLTGKRYRISAPDTLEEID